MKKYLLLILIISPLLAYSQLTGIWQDNNGTRYSLRQVENELFWRMDGRPAAYNVFHGVITDKTITGEWVDLPGGQKMGNGTLALEIITNDLIRKTAQNGNYGASEWIRIPIFTQPVDEPIGGTKSSMSSDWKEIYSFGGPKVPLGELLPPPETKMLDRVLLEKMDDENPKAKLRIGEIRLEPKNNHLGKCHWPGDIIITVKNIGHQVVDENDKTGIIGKITMIGFSEEKGAYERVNADLRFGHGPREWGRLKYGMNPLESKEISVNFTGVEGMTVSQIGHYFVRVELTKPIWDENAQKERYVVVQSVLKEFNPPGFDLTIPAGNFYIYTGEGYNNSLGLNNLSLGIQVKNDGELATPGDVGIRVIVPVIDRKNVWDNFVEFHYNFGKPFEPEETEFLGPGDLISLSHPEKGKPDLKNLHVTAYSTCASYRDDAFDKDFSNNFFYGKSRKSFTDPKYK